MLLHDLTSSLGYNESPLYREDDAEDLVALSDRHWVREARHAGAKGTYFFKTSPEPQALRPAVHVAEATTVEEAREIHRKLWNQGVNPFLIVLLPGQVRVFTGFAFNPTSEDTGAVTPTIPTNQGMERVIAALSAFTADAINRGEIWERNAAYLGAEQRVDTTLLKNLQALAEKLETDFRLPLATCHALIGKFVYLAYLRARDILSDRWLREEAGVDPATLFRGEVFAPTVTLDGFRKLVRTLEKRFNGKLFPIAWGSQNRPRADAIRLVARVFAGDEVTGQTHLPFGAYDFASIPVEFLSSIYEQFLHSKPKQDEADEKEPDGEAENEASDPEKRGAHYTPEPLADYLVSEINSVKPLRLGMRVLDPCCGSGIFLVVAFRRLVEMKCAEENRSSLNASELKVLLTTSIYAVERNPIACQIAAFSLILAMLGYVDPPELHRQKRFKFPTLVGNNLFREDFFDDKGRFWQEVVVKQGIKFDLIAGNPPWVELDQKDPESKPLLTWAKAHTTEYALARARTGEAFAWRVMECLADEGTVGLILSAKTLTNDHLEVWRKKFFSGVSVRRVTNFANLAYVIFASAQAPAITLIYCRKKDQHAASDILHYGPFVANQCVTKLKRGKKSRAWSLGFSESEIKSVSHRLAESGQATFWKKALWGTSRDDLAIKRLSAVFSTTLGKLALAKQWKIALGLQLRTDKGKETDPNEVVLDSQGVNILAGLKVLDHKALVKAKGALVVPKNLLKPNEFGCYVRIRGGTAGLSLARGPRLFLWNDFAGFADEPFIIRHSKVGLAGGTATQMKAVAAVWNSSYVSYLLFFVLSSDWGIGPSLIDKGDAENLPFPDLTPEREKLLSAAWEEAAALEADGADFAEVKELLDQRVAAILGLPNSVALVVGEFFRVRYQLNKGKNPSELRHQPNEAELTAYAARLRTELDSYLAGKAHHRVVVLHSSKGIGVSVTLAARKQPFPVEIRTAEGDGAKRLSSLLAAAEAKFSQWVYVKRSIRLFDGDTVHLIKPPRRLEWTETQAMLDADDIIAEVLEERQRKKA